MSVRLVAAALLLGLLAGCGTRAGHGVVASPPTTPTASTASVLHLLSRVTYGPRPGDLERVRALGPAAYLEEQLHPDAIDDSAVDAILGELPTLDQPIEALLREYPQPDPALRKQLASGEMSRAELLERYPPDRRPYRITAELAAAKMIRAVASERQLQEVMVDFWFNHFNVFSQKGDVRWYVGAYEREAIRPHALGKFRDLVRATARHPAMLSYLDTWLSTRSGFTVPAGPSKGKRAGLNENYARELMELHTLGVDGGYTQRDVTEVARAFTGWTIDRPRVDARFVFRGTMHDRGEKVVLGQRIPSGGGQEDGERVIDILTRDPSTARFVATKLVRRFVADSPPPALVERVAATYRDTDGDIRAMLRTIVADPGFDAEGARGAKVKTPFELAASGARALGARLRARGGFALARAAAEMGEPLYLALPPTGYADRAETWLSTGTLLARMNFALALASRRYPGVSVDLAALAGDGTSGTAADRLLDALLHRPASAATRAALAAEGNTGGAPASLETLAALVIGSPEFQRR